MTDAGKTPFPIERLAWDMPVRFEVQQLVERDTHLVLEMNFTITFPNMRVPASRALEEGYEVLLKFDDQHQLENPEGLERLLEQFTWVYTFMLANPERYKQQQGDNDGD